MADQVLKESAAASSLRGNAASSDAETVRNGAASPLGGAAADNARNAADAGKRNTSWWDAHKPSKRRIIQLYSALLYNAHVRGFAEGKIFTGKTKAVCVPGFNCYSCPGAVGACPLGSIQNALGSLNRHIGFYVLGIILLYGMLLGRTICGWICPLGLIQELFHKIPTPKIKKSRITRGLSYLKYVLLVIFVIMIPVYYGVGQGIPVPGFCKYICPAGTFEGAMGMLPGNLPWLSMLGIIFTRKFIIMVLIFTACIFCYRAFCRFLCPLGAIYGMFNSLAVIGVKVDAGKCNGCSLCVMNCKMDVKEVGDHECIHCAKCVAGCGQGALSMKAGKFTIIEPHKKTGETGPDTAGIPKMEKLCWGAAILLLAFLLIWANILDPSLKPKADTTGAAAASSPAAPNTQKTAGDAGTGPAKDPADKTQDAGTGASGDQAASAGLTAPETAQAGAGENAEENQQTEPSAAFESDLPIGYEPGSRLADFEIDCLDGSTFRLRETRGKVVFINLWATYCGPCVKELPHFVDLYHEHEGDIEMVAVHANLVTDDVSQYLSERNWDIHFAVDDEAETVFGIVNGSLALPQTIVLNRKGEVIYNKVGSVTPEALEQLYQEAAK